MVTASVVPINAAAIPDTPAATPFSTLIGASIHAILVPSGLWPAAALVLGTAPTHAAIADSNASTRSDAVPAASIIAHIVASAAPVHRAALHRGQRHSRAALHAACAQPPP